jgi:hypothetical protein
VKVLPLAVTFMALLPCFVEAQTGIVTNRDTAAAPTNLIRRHYVEGETVTYHMRASNKSFFGTTSYEADASGVVKIDSQGRFYEEYCWADLMVNNKQIALPSSGVSVCQSLSLDPAYGFSGFPDLTKVAPGLTGPMLDLFNFYVDLQLAIRQKDLARVGDHVFLKYGKAASWAHGSTILGEDAVDFDITLKGIDQAHQVATVTIRHMPPARPEIRISADWMRAPVADTPNNWVQVSKNDHKMIAGMVVAACLLILFLLFHQRNSRRRWIVATLFFLVSGLLLLCAVATPYLNYMAMVGKETFDCEIKVNLVSGKIVSATMDNRIELVARPCADKTLTWYGPSFRGHFRRQIDIQQR